MFHACCSRCSRVCPAQVLATTLIHLIGSSLRRRNNELLLSLAPLVRLDSHHVIRGMRARRVKLRNAKEQHLGAEQQQNSQVKPRLFRSHKGVMAVNESHSLPLMKSNELGQSNKLLLERVELSQPPSGRKPYSQSLLVALFIQAPSP